ncbi:hypothetical protein GAU_1193 [Gemmatimonas aurantiaca T-27]|uniref:FlgD Ig-like domain-containing protein n=1 Tax=Gemmatimonas aurantiaca (strain DSM 14586 / JCM 11422 / NBRC 100505 / T-27) TaxID=379066 RepID=C1A7M5_GEMAT|nr:hypothetical protein [Gemmatimonas aurantiaca]BAH38235.1 hypothetical protein GAU_1193 [Gemmatimonas aurantiaca T-27]
MTAAAWLRRVTKALLLLVAGLVVPALAPRALDAQGIFLEGPRETLLTTVTPAINFLAVGLGPARPLQITFQVSTSSDFIGLVLDSTFTSMDTSFTIQVTRPLPPVSAVYWRARVRALAGLVFESAPIGPKAVPAWVTLDTLNSPSGNPLDIRRPLFKWHSPEVTPLIGPWRYDIEVLENENEPKLGVSGLTETTFRPATDLQANTSYRWSVRAWLPNGASYKVMNLGSIVITDQLVPTTTLLFQNFPNPFPSATSFDTCFWFDVKEPGANVKLDILDLRGNLVRAIVPGESGTSRFEAGRYGRGVAGGNSNCDGRFVWNGTASDGRTVAPGVYLARFQADRGAPLFRRIVFRGR